MSLSESLDKKIYNYYEVIGSVVKVYYWNQKENKEIYFLVDKEDFEKISDRYWSQNCNGYIFSRKGNIRVFLHRYIMNLTERDLVVDHINHDILDNKLLGYNKSLQRPPIEVKMGRSIVKRINVDKKKVEELSNGGNK